MSERFLIYTPPKGNTQGVAHLSTDGSVEDCVTRTPGYRESGGRQGDPKAEDLLAARVATRDYRKCKKCWGIGRKYGRG